MSKFLLVKSSRARLNIKKKFTYVFVLASSVVPRMFYLFYLEGF